MSSKAYRRGLATRRRVLGDEWVDRAIATTTPFNAEFQEMITRHAWDDIWNRPGLTHKVRRMLVVTTLLVLGRWEEFSLHVGAAIRSGDVSEDEIKEVLLQASVYAGIPAGNAAFKEARQAIDAARARRPKAKTAR